MWNSRAGQGEFATTCRATAAIWALASYDNLFFGRGIRVVRVARLIVGLIAKLLLRAKSTFEFVLSIVKLDLSLRSLGVLPKWIVPKNPTVARSIVSDARSRRAIYRVAAGIRSGQWIVQDVSKRINRLTIPRRLNHRIDTQEPPEVVIKPPPVHVNELPVIEMLVIGKAPVRNTGADRALVRPAAVARLAVGIVAAGLGEVARVIAHGGHTA